MKKKLIIGAALSALALAAQAYEFDFTARVTYTDGSLSGVSTDTLLNGHFSAEGEANDYANFNWSDMAQYSFASGQVTAEVGGHTIFSAHPSIRLYDNLGGNVEDGFSMDSGYELVVDDTTYSQGAFGFNLTTVPGNTGVIHGLDLPSQVNVADFDGHSSLTYGYLQRDGGQGGGILGFQVLSVNVTSVPEPGSAALLAIGLLATAGVRRQRSTN
jgi:hypothetical protein